MKITFSDKLIAYLTLISGLSISAVAVWYSVAGLVSIFAAAVVPIMVMGIALELSKLVATVWLKMNWKIAPVMMRTYLVVAIIILMFITSMGIFGFLSKAHLDQAVPTGDVAARVQMIDDKIKTEQDNVAAAKAALTQMDNQVNERLSRSTDDKGAERAVQIRKNQAKERKTLQNDIATSQKEIAKLREERAPIASELRKVEAEVGPIKYIAALIYGDNPDQNILEKAVRAVIIIIVAVFDPLAVVLLLASQYSFQYFRRVRDDEMRDEYDFTNAARGPVVDDEGKAFFERGKELAREIDANDGFVPKANHNPADVNPVEVTVPEEKEESIFDKHPYLKKPWAWVPKAEVKEEPVLITRIAVPESNVDLTVTPPKEFDAEEYYEYLDGQPELEESDILEAAEGTEKAAMHRWKEEHPNSSLKLQRRLFEKGIITELPWTQYLKPQADFTDDESKKKDTVTWMETENGHQVKKSKEI